MMNTQMFISGMMHDVLKLKPLCKTEDIRVGTMIEYMVDYIMEHRDELMGKERFIRIIINQLVDVKSMSNNDELLKKVQSMIDGLFDMLNETHQNTYSGV